MSSNALYTNDDILPVTLSIKLFYINRNFFFKPQPSANVIAAFPYIPVCWGITPIHLLILGQIDSREGVNALREANRIL